MRLVRLSWFMYCFQYEILCLCFDNYDNNNKTVQHNNNSLIINNTIADEAKINDLNNSTLIAQPTEVTSSQEIIKSNYEQFNKFVNSSERPTAPFASSTLALWQTQSWFSDNYINLINPHWFEFAPPPKVAHYILAAMYVFIMTAGVFGNSLVIFMFVKCRSLRTPANILVTNLAVSDLTMMLKMPLFIYNSMHQGFASGELGCQIYGFVGGLTGTVSICTLAAIALDRYYVIVYPLNRSSTTIRAKICIVIAWIYGTIFSSIPLFNLQFGTYVPEGYLTSCSFDYLTTNASVKHFILCYFVAAWLIPFLIISFCYSKIIKAVVQARNIGNKMQDPSISGRHCKEQEQKRKEIRLALVVLAIIGLWFVAWTPYAIVALLGIAGQSQLITPLTSMIPALFCKTSSCLDPFVYAVTNQKFKEELKMLFCKRRAERDSTSKKVWSTNVSRQATVKKDENSDEMIDIEEEEDEENMVMVDLPMKNSLSSSDTEKCPLKKGLGRSMVQPVDDNASIKEVPLSSSGKRRASWVLRPTFSNRSSSLRNMARSWNRSRDNSVEIEENISLSSVILQT